jgi:hypothetical protein
MFLHARELAFDHPASGERITLQAPLPAECATLLPALMTRPRRFDLIAFDWDGTLFDSTALIARCIQDACRDLGVAVPSDDRRRLRHRPGPARRAAARGARLPPERYPELGRATATTTSRARTSWCCSTARWRCCRR